MISDCYNSLRIETSIQFRCQSSLLLLSPDCSVNPGLAQAVLRLVATVGSNHDTHTSVWLEEFHELELVQMQLSSLVRAVAQPYPMIQTVQSVSIHLQLEQTATKFK